MSINKEQVLLLAVVLLAVWVGSGYLETPTASSRYSAAQEEYVEHPVVPTRLVGDFDGVIVRRDYFTEPSETRPLPPRRLAFPPLPPLSLCGLP
ncbi:MAG TPA: hypothetical protein ENI87_11305, partial [bacterium]|nr:hypothetical protein [bacterium]